MAAGIGLGTTAKYMQQTTSGAAGNGLYTAIQYVRGAAGNGLSTTPRFCVAGASQLLKPASTTPRSYGRRNRSWHAHFKNFKLRAVRILNFKSARPLLSILLVRAARALLFTSSL
jgi:hypothetical protein